MAINTIKTLWSMSVLFIITNKTINYEKINLYNYIINFIINFIFNYIINFFINFIINFIFNLIIDFFINYIINYNRRPTVFHF